MRNAQYAPWIKPGERGIILRYDPPGVFVVFGERPHESMKLDDPRLAEHPDLIKHARLSLAQHLRSQRQAKVRWGR